MEIDLASRFAEQQTNQIEWDGPLFSLYELPTEASALTIRFLSATSVPPQGVRLKVRGGTFDVEGTSADDLVLWQDTAPSEVRARIKWKSKVGRSLRIWNAWRVNDVTQAWLGNAGMRVTLDEPQLLTLRCSDGEGEPNFDDLVVEVFIG